MSFTLITGSFQFGEGVPDGDSVRFLADDDSLFDRLRGRPVEFKEGGSVQLRYEGVDAIEKAAIKPYAVDSRELNFSLLRGGELLNEAPRGFILSRQTDVNRRPVCFAFAGDPVAEDGATVFLDADLLKDSVNYQLVLNGYAYPMFYETLFMELRAPIAEAFLHARDQKWGIHETESSMSGVDINSRNDLATIPPIYPKLWRRLEEYTRNHPNAEGFKEFLELKKKDKLNTISDSRFNITFDDVVEVQGTTVRLLYEPQDLVFKPA